jgi:radical SAM protein with 4Fe4S-binding SPASM domain
MLKAWPDPRISATIALTVTPANADRIDEIYSALRTAGVSSVFPVLMREQGVQTARTDGTMLRAAYGTLAQLIADSGCHERKGSRFVEAVHRAKNRIVHGVLKDAANAGRYQALCSAGSYFGTIMADGTVAPCELLASRLPLGNLRGNDMDFLRIWKSREAIQAKQAIRRERCRCTFECAWTVTVLARPAFWPRLALTAIGEML